MCKIKLGQALKLMFFKKKYIPKNIKSPNIYKNRDKIFNNYNPNLLFLLNKRFQWMEKYVLRKKNVFELGSGNGCLKKVLNYKNIKLTDIIKYSWIDKKIDMLKVNLEKKYHKKVDVFIINHSLHHCANPAIALEKCLNI